MKTTYKTVIMPREEYLHLLLKNNSDHWEALTNDTCTLKDLDRDKIKDVVNKAVDEKRLPATILDLSMPGILRNLRLMEDKSLTNAAVLLFCKNEDKQFPQSRVQISRFKGKKLINTTTYAGNIFDLYDKAFDHAISLVPAVIPHVVLKEAIINALAHRDYSQRDGLVSIAVHEDRITIFNTGGLPPGFKIPSLYREHRSMPRNPYITDVMCLCRNMERWGRGTFIMIQECKRVGLPTPLFEETVEGFSITLKLKE